MKYKILSILILGMFLISFTSAVQQTLGTFKQSEKISLIQTCSNCTYNNITGIISPNSTKILENVLMTKDGTFYNYSFSDTSLTGEYIINGIGDLDGTTTIWSYNLFITQTGTQLTDGESKIYTTIIFIMFFLLSILIFFIFSLPSENERGEDGAIIGIVKLKYIRIFFIAITYPVTIIILNLMNGLAINFANLTIFAGTLGFLFDIMLRLAWIFTVFIIIWLVYNLIKDTNFKKAMDYATNPLPGTGI